MKVFFAATLVYFVWLILYILAFTAIYNKDILLLSSRFLYGLSFLDMYLMVFFVLFFDLKKISQIVHITIITLLLFIFFLSAFSNFVIIDMLYSNEYNIYYEAF